METKEYDGKKKNSASVKKSKKKLENTWRQMKTNTHVSKTYGMRQKQF